MDNIIIDVRNTRACVSRKVVTDSSFTYEPCANWEWLEDAASEAIARLGGSVTLSALYPCPPELMRFALWPEDILEMVTTPQEAEAELKLGSGTTRKAAEAKTIHSRRAGSTWLLFRPEVRESWGSKS